MIGVIAFSDTALALPSGRVYEMASPPYKGGYDVGEIDATATSGEGGVVFTSLGVFANSPGPGSKAGYLARRSPAGWLTEPLIPPAEMASEVHNYDFSTNLDSSLVLATPGQNNGWTRVEAVEEQFLLHRSTLPDIASNWEVAGVPVRNVAEATQQYATYEGASPNFCHILLKDAPLVLGAGTGELYDDRSACGGGPSLSLVGTYDSGSKHINAGCPVNAGSGAVYTEGIPSEFNTISASGETIFFTTSVLPPGPGSCKGGQLFASLGEARDIEVSKPLTSPCGEELPCQGAAARPPGHFSGANEDGSMVFFTTAAALSSTDKDTGNDLYMARIGCPGGGECEQMQREVVSLTQLSHSSVINKGVREKARVQGVVRIAPNGERVYFVAEGVLGEGMSNVAGQAPVDGADNLYVYDTATEEISFIADLCSAAARSGEVEEIRCPADVVEEGRSDIALWLDAGEAQTADAGGRFLVFASMGRLTVDDTDNARDIYRYDAVTGALERVSTGEDSYDQNGNDGFDARIASGHWGGGHVYSQYETDVRAISQDGSRIVFTTAGPLSPQANNGLTHVYEWHKDTGSAAGEVGLVSPGVSEVPESESVLSPSGRDLYFVTRAGLVPQDTDGARDIYDARIGGGSPEVAVDEEPCASDACQESLPPPAPLLVPGSAALEVGETIVSPSSQQATGVGSKKAKKEAKKKAKKEAKKKAKKGVGRTKLARRRSAGAKRSKVGRRLGLAGSEVRK